MFYQLSRANQTNAKTTANLRIFVQNAGHKHRTKKFTLIPLCLFYSCFFYSVPVNEQKSHRQNHFNHIVILNRKQITSQSSEKIDELNHFSGNNRACYVEKQC